MFFSSFLPSVTVHADAPEEKEVEVSKQESEGEEEPAAEEEEEEPEDVSYWTFYPVLGVPLLVGLFSVSLAFLTDLFFFLLMILPGTFYTPSYYSLATIRLSNITTNLYIIPSLPRIRIR